MVLRDREANYNHYIFNTTVPIATELGSMVTYQTLLVHEVTRPIENVVLLDHVTK